MVVNMPDMNFGLTKNVKNYYTRYIEDQAINCIRSVSHDPAED